MKITALVTDLMDRSRISAAMPDVTFAATAADVGDADVVIVDLTRFGGDVAAVRIGRPGTRIVAYGPHVDDATLERADADGADLVLARSAFFRDPVAHLASTK